MYKHILIPTDGSALADKAVQHGITLAKKIGAKITILTVSVPFHVLTTDAQMIEDTAPQYKRRTDRIYHVPRRARAPLPSYHRDRRCKRL